MSSLDEPWRAEVAAARVARLATVRRDGRPHVVPITFALVGDEVVSVVDRKPKSTLALARLANVAAHPSASVLVDHYDDDWSQLWWARADGSVEVVPPTAGGRWHDAVGHLTAKYPIYRTLVPPGPVLVLTVERWATWRASSA